MQSSVSPGGHGCTQGPWCGGCGQWELPQDRGTPELAWAEAAGDAETTTKREIEG